MSGIHVLIFIGSINDILVVQIDAEELNMNNSQFSKCKVCSLDEKFVLNESRACKNKCMENKKSDHKDAVFRKECGPAITGYWG